METGEESGENGAYAHLAASMSFPGSRQAS